MDSLRPCPFCGGEGLELNHAPTYMKKHPDVYCVLCFDCGARGSEEWTEAVAIEAWNTRACDECERGAVPMTEENMREHGWVKERTCSMIYNEIWSGDEYYPTEAYVCSECNGLTETGKPRYCPSCGAKVIGVAVLR